MIAKMFGTDENYDVIVNPDKGDFEIWRNREVVADLRQPPLILFHHQYPGHVSGFFFLLKTTLNKYQV